MATKSIDDFIRETEREEDVIDYNTTIDSLEGNDDDPVYDEEEGIDDEDDDAFNERWYPQ